MRYRYEYIIVIHGEIVNNKCVTLITYSYVSRLSSS